MLEELSGAAWPVFWLFQLEIDNHVVINWNEAVVSQQK